MSWCENLLLPLEAKLDWPTFQTLLLRCSIYTPEAVLQAALNDKQSSNTFVFTYSLPGREGMPRSGNCLLNDLRALWRLLPSS